MRDVYGAFTLRGTQTDTDTDKMGTEPNGNTFHTVLGNPFSYTERGAAICSYF